jgi:histone acetyltransferase (RNA polymerase elongator complex component)
MSPKRYIVPLFVPHAGCENTCVFCDQRQVTGKITPAAKEDVQKAISRAVSIIDKNQPAEIAFFGGSFTAIPITQQQELLEAAQPFLGLNSDNSIRVSTRPDCVGGRTVVFLKKYGVKTVELGAQSMCDDVLIAAKRGHTSKDVENAAETIKNAGLELVLQMMTGLPGDTPEKSLETAKKIIALKPNAVRIYPTVIVRGTKLHEMWGKGEYKEHSLEEATALCSEIVPLFWQAEIPIIRLGLNPTKEFDEGFAAVAGAYHPAFGELVYSNIYYKRATALFSEKNIAPQSDIVIAVSKGRTSMMTGYCRENIKSLRKMFQLRSLKVVEGDLPAGDIVVVAGTPFLK